MKKLKLLLVCVLLLSGCSAKTNTKKNEKTKDPATEITSNSKVEDKSDKDKVDAETERDRIKKYNAYISFSNDFSRKSDDAFPDNHESYVETFTNGSGEFVKPESTPGIWARVPRQINIEMKLKNIVEMKPKMEVDKLGTQLIDTVDEMNKAIDELSQYMSVEEYENDDFAKAVELNKNYQEKRNKALEVSGNFIKKMNEMSQENEKKEIAAMKKKDFKIHLSMYNMVNTSRAMNSYIVNKYNNPEKLLEQLNAEEYDKLHKTLVENTNMFEKEMKNEKQLEKENLNDYSLENYMKKAKDLIQISEQLGNRLSSNEGYKDNELRNINSAIGNPEKVVKKCNELLDSYNSALN